MSNLLGGCELVHLLKPTTCSARAQLLSVPPYVLAAITTVLAGWMSDRAQMRAPFIMIFSAIGALGFLLLIATNIPGVQYTGLFLAAAGGYPLIPLVVSFGANNAGGSLKKGISTAIIVSVGNAGGCISAFVSFRFQDLGQTGGC